MDVGNLLGQMTLEEKVAQLTGVWYADLLVEGQLDDEGMTQHLSHGIGQITRIAGPGFDPVPAAEAIDVTFLLGPTATTVTVTGDVEHPDPKRAAALHRGRHPRLNASVRTPARGGAVPGARSAGPCRWASSASRR
jgi:hypothetical protein